jgi:hypothetical protein
MNRPVHLARRDVFFERAVDMLWAPPTDMETTGRIEHVESILSLLRRAEKHASFAVNGSRANSREHDFLYFLQLIAQNVQSVHAMMLNQLHLEEEQSFLCQFLATTQDECSLPAMAYGRRADDILQGLWHVLQQALGPYRTLQNENAEGMSEPERHRYERAAAAARNEVNGGA